MSLASWHRNGWLAPHRSSPQEVGDLLRATDRDLKDCNVTGLSADWRMNIAHNAALLAATAALAACGYRAVRESHRYLILQSLEFTIGANPVLLAQLDVFRKKRNLSGYEQAGVISEREAREMIQLALQVRNSVGAWLQANHPELLE